MGSIIELTSLDRKYKLHDGTEDALGKTKKFDSILAKVKKGLASMADLSAKEGDDNKYVQSILRLRNELRGEIQILSRELAEESELRIAAEKSNQQAELARVQEEAEKRQVSSPPQALDRNTQIRDRLVTIRDQKSLRALLSSYNISKQEASALIDSLPSTPQKGQLRATLKKL